MGRDSKGRGGKPGRGDGGRGRKDKRGGRGGGDKSFGGDKMYIENIDQLLLKKEKGEITESEDEEESEEESGEETEQPSQEGSGAQKSAGDAAVNDTVFAFQKKATISKSKADDNDEDDITNDPNFAKKEVDPNDPEAGMNRKERLAVVCLTNHLVFLYICYREALAKQKAKEDYMKRHLAGETDQAKREMARLAEVRARREAAAKIREAEGRAPGMSATGLDDDDDTPINNKPKPVPVAAAPPAPAPTPAIPTAQESAAAAVAARKKAAAAGDDDEEKAEDGGPPLVSSIDIKKMNGDALKDHCKARNLDIRGQKKDLMKRLLDHEAERAKNIAELKKN